MSRGSFLILMCVIYGLEIEIELGLGDGASLLCFGETLFCVG